MAAWHFADGTTLRSGGKVRGDGPAAVELRRCITDPTTTVEVFAPPSRAVAVDPSSDFLLHYLALEVARIAHVEVKTRYVVDIDDAPPELARRLHQARRDVGETPFGVVH